MRTSELKDGQQPPAFVQELRRQEAEEDEEEEGGGASISATASQGRSCSDSVLPDRIVTHLLICH